jgi:mannosidase alpha-like ER degradation enhancer 2
MEETRKSIQIQIHSSMLVLLLLLACISCSYLTLSFADTVTKQEAKQLRNEVTEMFYHAFNGYMDNAFPLDELKPLSCSGEDTLGGYALTLVRNFHNHLFLDFFFVLYVRCLI